MRLIGLPPAILLLGFLAALPFRRDSSSEESSVGRDVAVSLPRNVSPIVENGPEQGNTNSAGMKKSLDSRFGEIESGLSDGSRNPYELSVERLPKSYEEVAVPLVLDGRSPNLLSAAPVSALAPGDILNRSTVDRFGIPRAEEESVSMENSTMGTVWNGPDSYSGMKPPASILLPNHFTDRGGWSDGKSIREFTNSQAETFVTDSRGIDGISQEEPKEGAFAPSIRMTSRQSSLTISGQSGNDSFNPIEPNVASNPDDSESQTTSPNPSQVTPTKSLPKKRHLIREPRP